MLLLMLLLLLLLLLKMRRVRSIAQDLCKHMDAEIQKHAITFDPEKLNDLLDVLLLKQAKNNALFSRE